MGCCSSIQMEKRCLSARYSNKIRKRNLYHEKTHITPSRPVPCERHHNRLRIMTTGRAGGLRKPPWGMSQAEPIGSPKESANRTTFTDMPLKGTFLLVLCYWLTCKRVYKLFYTHLIFFMILLQLIPYVLLYCFFISSYCVYIISPTPKMPVPIFVLQICIFLKYHQTALPFEISHYL